MERAFELTPKVERGEESGEKAKTSEVEELKQEIKKQKVVWDEAAELVKVKPELGKEEPVSQQQKVRTAAKLLRGVPDCSRVHPILQARVPIVKFTHRDTGVQCDISFKNRLSVVNTAWIRLCVDSDPRVRSFLVTLRYFAKVYGLAGGGGGGKLSSYALTLLGIVFLQVIEPPLLPPVATLQAVPDLPPDCVDGWNCSFASQSIPELPKNCLSTLQLLGGFFTWASKLDFDGM